MEIIPGIHWIQGINGNVYVVAGEELVLIDTGMPHRAKKIANYITQELQRPLSDLKWILLTHCDVDHIGNVQDLKRLSGAQVAAHPIDAEVIAGRQTRARGAPKGGMRLLMKMMTPLMKLFVHIPPFEVDLLLNDGDTVAGLEVYHVPGHSMGSIAFYDAQRKVLFSGDELMYRNGKLVISVPIFTADASLARLSAQKLSLLDFDTMLAGHGEPLQENASDKVREFIGTESP